MSRVVHRVVVIDSFITAYTAKAVLVDDLRIPIHFALGRYEAATQEELNDAITDLQHELDRRADPYARAA